MTGTPVDWKARAVALADRLTEQGAITDPAWRRVVETVPRHVFVPEFYSDGDPPELITARDARWLDLAYSDDTLVTQRKQHPDQPGFSWSTSSSTRPGFMLRLLHLLDVGDGMDVLEIGTGTGYTAALLCERLGSQHVSTVDIDPELTEAARRRLADAGYRPAVTTGDGLLGDPAHAPFDRVLATVATERVPYTWVEQTRPGGVILADVRPRGMTWAGALARLTVTDDGTADGPLIPTTSGFMSTRREADRPGIPETAPIDTSVVRTRTSPVGGAALRTPGLSLLIWQRLPGITVFPRPHGARIVTPDASWATVTTTAPATVEYGGPTDLWQQVEDAHAWWTDHGTPDVDAFELTVTPDEHRVRYRVPERQQAAPGAGPSYLAISERKRS